MAAIEARAKMSLAGTLDKTSDFTTSVLDESALSRNHGVNDKTDDGSVNVSAAVASTQDVSGPLNSKGHNAATITLHELEKVSQVFIFILLKHQDGYMSCLEII